MTLLGGQGGYFEKLSNGLQNSDMTSEVLGEMFKGNFADICVGKLPLMQMGAQAEGQMRRDYF